MDARVLKDMLDERHEHVSGLLRSLDPDRTAQLAAHARIQTFPRGERIIAEGEPNPSLTFLLDGALGMVKRLPDRQTHIVGLLVPGDMFGRLFDGPLSYDVESLSRATTLSFERGVFERAAQSSPKAEQQLLVAMLDELDTAREWILLLGGRSATERLAGFLLILLRRRLVSRRSVPDGGLWLKLPLKRVDLAQYLGVRPESLSRAFRRLREAGVVTVDGAETVVIRDLAALIAESGRNLLHPPADGGDSSG